jgi:septal ring factor EnvC (AmiA/AmiB activator)
VLLTTDPPEVVVCQLLRLLEAVYNMQVFRLSTQGMVSVVLMDSTATRDILTLNLQYEIQTIAHLQQELVALQNERIQWHQERAKFTEQLHARDHALEMTQVQLAHTEAQHFALVQNVAEMQNQVAEMEIEVEVWQAMAQQGQQPPIAPPAARATPDELQGVSSLSEDSVGGPPPDSPDTSAGSAAGY